MLELRRRIGEQIVVAQDQETVSQQFAPGRHGAVGRRQPVVELSRRDGGTVRGPFDAVALSPGVELLVVAAERHVQAVAQDVDVPHRFEVLGQELEEHMGVRFLEAPASIRVGSRRRGACEAQRRTPRPRARALAPLSVAVARDVTGRAPEESVLVERHPPPAPEPLLQQTERQARQPWVVERLVPALEQERHPEVVASSVQPGADVETGVTHQLRVDPRRAAAEPADDHRPLAVRRGRVSGRHGVLSSHGRERLSAPGV